MKKVLAAIAAAIAFAAVPSASIAQNGPKVTIGAAMIDKDNQVTIAEIRPGSTAELMGIRVGDVITHAGGKPVKAAYKLRGYLRGLQVGDPLKLTVERQGKSVEVTGTARGS